jgi:hypothetical protein
MCCFTHNLQTSCSLLRHSPCAKRSGPGPPWCSGVFPLRERSEADGDFFETSWFNHDPPRTTFLLWPLFSFLSGHRAGSEPLPSYIYCMGIVSRSFVRLLLQGLYNVCSPCSLQPCPKSWSPCRPALSLLPLPSISSRRGTTLAPREAARPVLFPLSMSPATVPPMIPSLL